MSSLSAQLAARTTLDSSRLASVQSLKHPPSFIYTPRHAASLSITDLHHQATNAWEQLVLLDSRFSALTNKILGEEAKGTDRTNLTRDENEKLDKVLDKCLRLLGRFVLIKPAGVVIEWLIRRFRVNDLNLGSLIALILPYHQTPHFPSLLSTLAPAVLAPTPFSALIPVRTSLAPLPLSSLIALTPPASSVPTAFAFLTFLLRLPLGYLTENETPHRSLVGFWLQFVSGYLDRAGTTLPEGEKALVLSTILELIRESRGGSGREDSLVAGLVALARFVKGNPLGRDEEKVVMKCVVGHKVRKDPGEESEGREDVEELMLTTLVVVATGGEGTIEVKEGKRFLGGSAWKGLLRVSSLGEILVKLCHGYDAARFMTPFLHTLSIEALTDPTSLTLLSSLLTPMDDASAELPPRIITLLTSAVFATVLSSSKSDVLIPVLSKVYQRHPEVYSGVTTALLTSTTSSDELSQVLSSVISGRSSLTSSALSTTESPDLALRLIALRSLLDDESVLQDNPAFVHDTLLARLGEAGEVEIVKMLLGEKKGREMIATCLEGEEVLDVLKRGLDNAAGGEYEKRVVEYLVGPFGKLRNRVLGEVVWGRILGGGLGGVGMKGESWISGIGGEDAGKIAETIAGNIARQDAFDEASRFLISTITIPPFEATGDEPSLIRANGHLLALLVCGQLAHRLSPDARIVFVGSVLEGLRTRETGLHPFASIETEPVVEGSQVAENVTKAIKGKPKAAKTRRRLRCATLLLVVASIIPPKGFNWGWLTPTTTPYGRLAREVYGLAHTGTTKGTSALSSIILHSLYTKFLPSSSVLTFLASIYTALSPPTALKIIALKDAATFIQVQTGAGVDFQCVVPSLLVCLMSQESGVRKVALETLECVEKSAPGVSTAGAVYGKDKFYGEKSSGSLKYLDVEDIKLYIRGLVASRVEIIMDPSYVTVFHTSHLNTLESSSSSSSKKKSKSLQNKMIVFLLSHVESWSSSDVTNRTLLLSSISGIVDTVKSNLLVPLLEELVKPAAKESGRKTLFEGINNETVDEYCRLLLAPWATCSRKWLDSNDNKAWENFVGAVQVSDLAGAGGTLRKEALAIVKASLFSLVRGEHRLDLLRRLIRSGAHSDARLAADYLECVRACKVDGETLTSFLGEIRLSMASPVSTAAKRGRTSMTSSSSRAERLPELIVILESLDLATVQVSHNLLLTLFELLSTLIELSASQQVDVQYAGQLMLGALAKVVENVQPSSNITSDSIRMAPVLDLMRSSTNPQTSHQALLLLAQLGPLVPEQLAHNIMPIFTFMGANVLQRDDAYSLRVVDRTLESIVPVLVKSMKTDSLTRDALISDLKALLRVFTDAANHVPRHRRTKLFVRFVETLGPSEFLSAVTLLLLDRSIKSSEPAALSLAIFESFSVDIQLLSLKQVIEEIPKLLLRGTPAAPGAPFLDSPSDSPSDADDIGASEKLQVLNLVHFLAFALDATQLSSKVDAARASKALDVDTTLSQLVHGLLSISNVALPELYTPNDEGDLATSVNYALQATVRLMSTRAFSEAVLWLLDLPEARVKASALALLRARLPSIKPTRRADISPAVVAVVERIRASLVETEGALETLEAIADSVHGEEDLVLAKTVPQLLQVAAAVNVAKSSRVLAMGIIKKLAYRLGPRLIPLAAKIIPFCVETLRQEAAHPLAISSTIVTTSFQILEGLFTSIPTFIGGQLDKIFEAALSTDILSLTDAKEGSASRARAQLLSTAAKKLPAKTLYPAIIRLHASLDGLSKEPILGLLDLLNRALRQGKTVDIAENYRPIFKLFLTVFDLRRQHAPSLSIDDINQIEEMGLGAFTQFILKLNEQTFRPLFLRTYDWAVIDLIDEKNAVVALTARKTVLYKIVDRLLSQLKSIVVPYYSFMLDQTIELLDSFSSGTLTDPQLWTSVTSALSKALTYDETGFWTALRLSKLSTPLSSQLASSPPLSSAVLTTNFFPLLTTYANALVRHEILLKTFNSTLLMQTRSEDLRTKKNSLEALEALWTTLGDGMLPLVPETTPFLAETLEEVEGGVELTTKRLISRIEDHLGESLASYMEN